MITHPATGGLPTEEPRPLSLADQTPPQPKIVPAEWTDETLDELWDLLVERLARRLDAAGEAILEARIDNEMADIISRIRKQPHVGDSSYKVGEAWTNFKHEYWRAYQRKPPDEIRDWYFPKPPKQETTNEA